MNRLLMACYGILLVSQQLLGGGINDILDRYFLAVQSGDALPILEVFHPDAIIQTKDREYRGHDQIREFYQQGILKCSEFLPVPRDRHESEQSIAVEIELHCDGKVTIVGDFFYFFNDKISRLNVYMGSKSLN